ncbi:hypothetical protein J4558_07635 [Leptolyngbya sp. 15MV]|nr:hypothetical protein J4558_07635 [Leptolyngbya sp. 15MV]
MTKMELISVRLGMVCYAAFCKVAGRNWRDVDTMRMRLSENNDLVLEDIPDDLMETVANLARQRAISDEDMWREIIMRWSEERET